LQIEEILPVPSDLDAFRSWLNSQPDGLNFNVGCLFTIDDDGLLRACLHPKLVRSQYEHSPLPEHDMEEADLITLVTLVPSDKTFLSITLQPLLCSDALNLQTDRGTPPPLAALSGADSPFSDPPDHIDIVAVATCTPQVVRRLPVGDIVLREWHQEFRDSFCRTQAGDLPRHHFSTFILSNFEMIDGAKPAGLSGVFQPIDPGADELHPAVDLSCYGRPKEGGGNNSWSPVSEATTASWQRRGFIAALKPSEPTEQTAVKIFGFRLPNLLRDGPRWRSQAGPARCEVVVARWQSSDQLNFRRWSAHHDD
jgi:hypothetical protein